MSEKNSKHRQCHKLHDGNHEKLEIKQTKGNKPRKSEDPKKPTLERFALSTAIFYGNDTTQLYN